MAITALHYRLYKELHAAGLLPQGGRLLQIGQANWYGDISPDELREDARLLDRLDVCDCVHRLYTMPESETILFDIADCFWSLWLNPFDSTAIDFDGTEHAQPHDLNFPVMGVQHADVVVNNGTAEHVFNISQVFCTMHDNCKPGGIMIHDGPFAGWPDHGFYNLNPTLFWDLASANNYELIRLAVGDIKSREATIIESREHVHELAKAKQLPENSELFVVLRKREEKPFVIPHQGIYSNGLSEQAREAWVMLR